MSNYEAPDLLEAVREAITAAGDAIQASDGGAVALAQTYAHSIGEVIDSGDPQAIVKALYLGPHLLNTLRELGCTPAGRKVVSEKLAPAAPQGPVEGLSKFRVVG